MIGVKTKKDKQQLVEHKPQKQIVDSPVQADLQQALAFPQMATPDEVLALQQAAGNTAVTGWLGADSANSRLDEQFSSAVKQSHGSGMPLPPMLREEMEQSLKTSFDSVRLHTDEQADALSQNINARAFTIGSDIYFRHDTYSPNTPEGRHTLKHELTHVIQQGGRFDPQLKLGLAHDEHEQEAERFSQGEYSHPLAGKPDTTAPAGSVQRVRHSQDKDYKMQKLGGSLNTVYRVQHKVGNVGYFKPNDSPTMGAKSVLSSDINQTLGLNALSRETYARYGNKEGAESSEVPGTTLTENEFNTPITKAEYTKGVKIDPSQYKMKKSGLSGLRKKYFKYSGTKINTHDFINPVTQRDLSNLQLQDAITGQIDRHGGNIRIDPTTGEAKGYDNDLLSLNDKSMSRIKNLHKSSGANLADRYKARQQAISEVNTRFGKQVGLPSHIDKAAADKMLGLKSSAFMAQLEASNPENMARLKPQMKAELKDRYSTVRRYVKAGMAASGHVNDSTKAAKWSSPAYQEMVRKGAGVVPTIVNTGGWNRQTYNEQLSQNAGSSTHSNARSYLERSVQTYNEIQHQGGSMQAGGTVHHLDNPHAPALPMPPKTAIPPKPTTPVPHPPAIIPTSTVVTPTVPKSSTSVPHPLATTPTPTVVTPTVPKSSTSVPHPLVTTPTPTVVTPPVPKSSTSVPHPPVTTPTSTVVTPTVPKSSTSVPHPLVTTPTPTVVTPPVPKSSTSVPHPLVTTPTSTVVTPPIPKSSTSVPHPLVATSTPTVVPPHPRMSPKIRGLMTKYENM